MKDVKRKTSRKPVRGPAASRRSKPSADVATEPAGEGALESLGRSVSEAVTGAPRKRRPGS